MQKQLASDVARNPDALWRAATREPVSVEQDGKPIAIVLSPEAYSELIARHGMRGMSTGRRKSLTVDSNDLFGLEGDVFCNDGP